MKNYDFEGDEQDILSLYMINGLCIDQKEVEGRQLRFLNIDGVVRTGKIPRRDRTEFEIFGIPLNYYWRSTLEEIYRDTSLRHRFDILQVVLNQDPHALAGICTACAEVEARAGNQKEWRRLGYTQFDWQAGFVLAYHLTKRFMTAEEWVERSRTIARDAAAEIFEASDCAAILRIKKSKEETFDAISFHRLLTLEPGPTTQ